MNKNEVCITVLRELIETIQNGDVDVINFMWKSSVEDESVYTYNQFDTFILKVVDNT